VLASIIYVGLAYRDSPSMGNAGTSCNMHALPGYANCGSNCSNCQSHMAGVIGEVDAFPEYYTDSGEPPLCTTSGKGARSHRSATSAQLVKLMPAMTDGPVDLEKEDTFAPDFTCQPEPEPCSTSEWKHEFLDPTVEVMVSDSFIEGKGDAISISGLEAPCTNLLELIRKKVQDSGGDSKATGNLRNSASVPSLSFPAVASASSLEFDDLHLENMFFDPCREPLKSQLLQKMGVHQDADVEPIRGPIGGCNSGMWVLKNGNQWFMLKLLRILPAWMGPSRDSESEKYAKLSREHPEMVQDASLSFPCKIFHCLGKGGSKTHDLVVMRWVGGLRFSEIVMRKLHSGQAQDLMGTLQQFGKFLADFHGRYNGLQHGDLTPANVFFDEQTHKFALVDVADIAPRNPVILSDADRFISSLKLLSNFYGDDLWAQGKLRLEAGYKSRRSGGFQSQCGSACSPRPGSASTTPRKMLCSPRPGSASTTPRNMLCSPRPGSAATTPRLVRCDTTDKVPIGSSATTPRRA